MSKKVTKTKCFAYDNGKCKVLTNADCFCCKFYKTKEEFDEQNESRVIRAKKKGHYKDVNKYISSRED